MQVFVLNRKKDRQQAKKGNDLLVQSSEDDAMQTQLNGVRCSNGEVSMNKAHFG
jgi:hypothetical protein